MMTSQTLVGGTIGIGIATTLTNKYEVIGAEMARASQLAVEESNSQGGILGASVVPRTLDDESSVERAAVIAEAFCRQPEVLGVVGHYSSDVSIAASDIYQRCDLVMITPVASNPSLTSRGRSNVFRFTNSDSYTGRAIARYLYRMLGKRRAVLLEARYAYGQSMAASFVSAFSSMGGQILGRGVIDVGQREFGSLVKGLSKDSDVVFYAGAFEGADLLKAIRGAGMKQLFAAGDGCWDVTNFLEPANGAVEAGEGVLIVSATPDSTRSKTFTETYRKRYGRVTNYAVNSYDATRVLISAIRAAAAKNGVVPTRAQVVTSMRSTEFMGIAYDRPVAWERNGDNRAAVAALYVVRNGRFHQVCQYDRDNSLTVEGAGGDEGEVT